MKDLNKLSDKKIGLYIRKQRKSENISTGYGRLQWLRHELEDHEGQVNLYIDENYSRDKLKKIINDIRQEKVQVLLIWSIDDIDLSQLTELFVICFMKGVPIVSFCESSIGINKIFRKQHKIFLIGNNL